MEITRGGKTYTAYRWFRGAAPATHPDPRQNPPDAPPPADKPWLVPDWVQTPTAGNKPRWTNGETGEVRYGARPRGRGPAEKEIAWKIRERRLATPGADDGTPRSVAAAEAVLGPGKTFARDLLGTPPGTVATGGEVRTGPDGLHSVHVALDHPDTTMWSRSVYERADGTVHVHNNVFFLKPKYQGGGFGTKAFGDQVAAGFKEGVDSISTTAGKGGTGLGRMNGYNTWARLGYDADLAPGFKRRLPAGLKGAQTVQDLMETKEGRDHWRNHGYMTDMAFDLTPGSRSLVVLNRYRAEKGLPAAGVTPGDHAARDKSVADRKARIAARPKAVPAPATPPEPGTREVRLATAADPPVRPAQLDAVHTQWADRLKDTGLGPAVRKEVEKDIELLAPERRTERGTLFARGVGSTYGFWLGQLGADRHAERLASPEGRAAAKDWDQIARLRGYDDAAVAGMHQAAAKAVSYKADAKAAVDSSYAYALRQMDRRRNPALPAATLEGLDRLARAGEIPATDILPTAPA